MPVPPLHTLRRAALALGLCLTLAAGATAQTPDTLLLRAARAGDVAGLRTALAAGARAAATDTSGASALMLATVGGHEAAAVALVDAGADCRRGAYYAPGRTGFYGSLLAAAAAEGHLTLFKTLVARCRLSIVEPERDLAGAVGWTPMQSAAANGRLAIVRYLLDRGAALTGTGELTALDLALQHGQDSTAVWLLARNAPSGLTPDLRLFAAAGSGAIQAATRLLDAGAPVDAAGDNDETAFQNALAQGHGALARLLLTRGADPMRRNTLGWTSLHYAAVSPVGEQFIPDLAARGIPVEAANNEGVTALGMALLRGLLGSTRALIALGAAPATVAPDGWTALHVAARDGADGLLDTLLAARVPLSPLTQDGLTPLRLAASNEQAFVAARLVCAGADPALRAPDGTTAREAAAETSLARHVLDLAASGGAAGCRALRPFLDAQADIVRAVRPDTPPDTAGVLLARIDAAYTRTFGSNPGLTPLRMGIASAMVARGHAAAALGVLDALAADTTRLNDVTVRTLLYNRALALGALGRTREAIAAQRALLARETADPAVTPSDRALTEMALSKLLTEVGEIDEALALARGVLATNTRESGTDAPATHHAALSLGMAFYNTGRWDDLARLADEWRPRIAAPTVGDDVRASWGTLEGVLRLREGNRAGAEDAYRAALATRRRLYGDGSLETLRSLRDLVELYRAQENYADGRPLVDEAMATLERLAESGQRDPFLIVVLRDVSRFLAGQNDLTAAEAAARRTISLAGQIAGPGSLFEADGLAALGDVLLRTGRAEEAADAFTRAVAIFDARVGPDHLGRLTALSDLSEIHRRRGELDAARRLSDDFLPRMERAHPNEATLPVLYNNRSILLAAQGDRAGAAEAIERALNRSTELYGDGPASLLLRINAASNLARTDPARARGHAFAAARLAARQADTVLPALSMAEQQRFLETDLAVLSTSLVWLTRGRPSADTAYAFLSRYKGLLLRSLRHQADLARAGSPEAQALTDARRALAAHVFSRPPARADSAAVAAWQRRLARLTERREEAERRLTRGATAALRDPLGEGVDVRTLLGDGEAMLDLYRVARSPEQPERPDYHYIAAVVAPGVPVRLLDLGRADTLDAFVDAWRDAVRRGGAATEETRVLRKRLWWPLVEALPGTARRLWLSPDGQLARLPFDGFARDPRRPFALTTLDSPRDLAILRRGAATATNRRAAGAASGSAPFGHLLLVGDVDFGGGGEPFAPLPGTRFEIEAVRRLFRASRPASAARSLELTGTQATGSRVLDQLPGAAYVHLATHGTFAATPPGDYAAMRSVKPFAGRPSGDEAPAATTRLPLLESGLAFAGANTLDASPAAALSRQDGFVTAEEFIGVDLSATRLVVLSACETGRGREVTGQGVMGLRASFVTAGARTLLMSLWPVPDAATARLMERFYQALWRDGKAPGAALREAQASVREAYPAPVNWAGWVLAGEAW